MEPEKLVTGILAIEDKIALQELTNSFLAAADRKDNVAQASCFTENGTLISIMGDTMLTFEKRKGIADGFADILAPLKTVYHLSGQLATAISGNQATGTSNCFVTLAGTENDKPYVRKIWAIYKDEYVKENGKWLINKRIATVAWEERSEL